MTHRRLTAIEPTDRWVHCHQGHLHWGSAGAAGLLVCHQAPDGSRWVLLQQRSGWVDQPGTWGLPSGALGTNEDPVAGAVREAIEEFACGSDLPGPIDHRGIAVTDHGGWAFHTVVVRAAEQWAVEDLPGSDEVGPEGFAWYPVAQIGQDSPVGLHPGFRGAWATGALERLGFGDLE